MNASTFFMGGSLTSRSAQRAPHARRRVLGRQEVAEPRLDGDLHPPVAERAAPEGRQRDAHSGGAGAVQRLDAARERPAGAVADAHAHEARTGGPDADGDAAHLARAARTLADE